MPVLLSRGCAYHDGDMNGATYDSNGQPCGGMTSDEVIYIAAAAGFCGTVLLILGGIYTRRLFKARARDRGMQGRPMSSLGTPLITSTFFPPSPEPSQPATFFHPSPKPTRPALGRLVSAPSLDGHSASSHGSSEEFHFPILSADGHLLPAPLATFRQSSIDDGQASLRPLPSPPLQTAILSPIPQASRQWTYQPARSRSPSPDRVVGLYDGFGDLGDGPSRITKMEYGQVHRPQAATLHHSFSAEGEEILYERI